MKTIDTIYDALKSADYAHIALLQDNLVIDEEASSVLVAVMLEPNDEVASAVDVATDVLLGTIGLSPMDWTVWSYGPDSIGFIPAIEGARQMLYIPPRKAEALPERTTKVVYAGTVDSGCYDAVLEIAA